MTTGDPARPASRNAIAMRLHKQRGHAQPLGQGCHVRCRRRSLKPARRMEDTRQDVDVAGGIQEDLLPAQDIVDGQIDVGLILQRLIPGCPDLLVCAPTPPGPAT